MADRVDTTGDWDGPYDEGDEAFALPPFLSDPLGALRRRWIWMLSVLLLGLVATGAAVYTAKPIYLATSTILISGQEIPQDFVRSTVREDTIANINAMVGRVLSRENLERLISQLGLAAHRPEGTSLLDLVNELRAGVEFGPVQGFAASRRGESSIIYGIEYRSGNPTETAEVVNALAGLLMEASIDRRNQQARRTTAFLSRQLERDEAELRSQSQAIAEFRRQNRGVLPAELETSLRRLELLSERRRSITAQIASTENRMLTRAAQPQVVPNSENEILLEELQRQLARESAIHTDAHPNVIALRARVERLKVFVEQDVDGQVASGDTSFMLVAERRELAQLKRQLAETDVLIEEINARIERMPSIGEQLSALEQKEQVLRERYLDSLRKVEEAELAESLESAQQGARVSVLDPAQVPTAPEQPRWLLAAGGIAVAFALALALGVLLELIDPVIVNVAQLERLGGPACLGSLPQSA